jgi:hypothetical protein
MRTELLSAKTVMILYGTLLGEEASVPWNLNLPAKNVRSTVTFQNNVER